MGASSARAVGVVGAGGSGVAVATALQRAGLDFEILEARDGVGGSWRYDPEGDGSACYASLVANTSKLRMQILGRKIGGRLWQYASHSEMLGYLESIADREGLRRHLRLGWRVTAANHADGTWTLRSANGEERQYRDAHLCAWGQRPASVGIPHGRLCRRAASQCCVSNPGALHGPRRRRYRARDVGHGDRWGSGGARTQRRRGRANADVGDDAAARRLTDRLVCQSDARSSLALESATPNDRRLLHTDDRRSAPPRRSTPDSSLR